MKLKLVFVIMFLVNLLLAIQPKLLGDTEVVWTYYVQNFMEDEFFEAKISPDSKYIAVTDRNYLDSISFKVLNITDGSIYKNILGADTNGVYHIVWINDSLIAGDYSSKGNSIRIWNINTGNPVYTFPDSNFFSHGWYSQEVQYCQSGKLFINYANDSSYLGEMDKRIYVYSFDSVLVINTNNWQIERKFRANHIFIRPSPECSYYLVEGYRDNNGTNEFSFLFYDINTDSLLWDFDPPDHFVRTGTNLGISPNGRYLLHELSDTIVRVIDFQNRTSDSIKLGWNHKYSSTVCFSPVGDKYMMIGSGEGYFYEFGIFNINSGNKLYSFFDSTTANLGLEASKDSQYILSVDDKELRLFHINWNVTSIQDNNGDNPQYLFPNPTSGDINIPIDDNTQDSRIELYDLKGNLVKTFLINSSINKSYLISNNEIMCGSYMIHVKSGLSNKTYKVIINK